MPVLIAGAGPTGLVLALWLTKLGIAVRIIDRTSSPGTTSRAVAVQARTLELYRQVGLAAPVVDAGVKIAGVNLWIGAHRAAHLRIADLGKGISPFPFPLTYPQDAHERLLVDQLASLGVHVERETSLTGFEQLGDHIHATLRTNGGADSVCDASYLAGCDGAHSTVRETLGIEFPGSTYSGVFYVADVNATGAATDGDIHVELEDADFIAVFPLKGTGRLRVIGPATWTQGETDRKLTFDDVRDRVTGKLGLAITAVNWFSTYRVHHRVASRFRDRRVFLLGDAAHVHSPVGGQGMNTGIGDAVNLSWKLAAAVRGEAGERVLASYEQERIGFARVLVATTDRAFTLVTKQGPIARLVRTRIAPLVAPIVLRFPAVRRRLFRTVSQTGVQYRASTLSSGVAGEVHGGDRLPWAPLHSGGDNHSVLALRWQLHVYGAARRDLAEACDSLRIAAHQFAWEPSMASAGLREGAAYLVRPDGYVAVAGVDNASSLRDYMHALSS